MRSGDKLSRHDVQFLTVKRLEEIQLPIVEFQHELHRVSRHNDARWRSGGSMRLK
jgi:hypothetical protein